MSEVTSTDRSQGLLSGIRLLDLADEKASFCTKLLADMGASVVKVERPGGDPSRWTGPFQGDCPGPETSLFFSYNNTNKLGITLHLDHPEGREIFRKLIPRTDVVVESFPPGHLKGLGLGFEVLKEINPKLILLSVTGFGQNGPRSHYKSCDLVASAFGGQMSVSGSPSSPPLKPFGEQAYYGASLFGAVAILLALHKRTRDGRGGQIDISLQEAVASTLDHVMVRYFYEKTITKRQGSLYWNNAFCILPCQNGFILLAPFQQWETVVEWMDSEGMAEDLKDERWGNEEYRQGQMDHILTVLGRWTRTHTREELFELGQLMHFPWAPVHSPEEVLNSPQLHRRHFFVEVDHPEGRSVPYPRSPYQFSGSFPGRWKRAPLVGEDNVQIYQKEMGLSDKELERLRSIQVI